GTTQYLTFECESDDAVTAATERAIANGARLLHDPYETYYGAFQSVLADPDGNVFRINHFR
ncbi:MAG TPA: VOC family protein, partial [Ilumatobacteraceae bacterium]|nr:VOC family protein [Ilumatobacteraceae bacterium]